MFIMSNAFPEEFRRDVIAVARKGEASITQINKNFGVSPAATIANAVSAPSDA